MKSICHYLEVAPSGWNNPPNFTAAADPTRTWAQATPVNYQLALTSEYGDWTQGVGFGEYMTKIIIDQGNDNPSTSAAALAAGYSSSVGGTTFSDWYLPSSGELRELCLNSKSIGNTFTLGNFWSSTTVSLNARYLVGAYAWPTCETSSGNSKDQTYGVRPIRSF
jgi:hypothetical protein